MFCFIFGNQAVMLMLQLGYRYSIWLDSKLRLDSDPLLILEYFLWQGKHEYAISNHYDRHCVWEEVEQNKCLNKFNHTIIDQQFQFYQEDGLTQFNESDPHRLLPSCEWNCFPSLCFSTLNAIPCSLGVRVIGQWTNIRTSFYFS
jgi:hypothetical protein